MAGPYDNIVASNGSSSGYNPRQQGVFANSPLMTPKYAKNRGLRDAEFRDTLARIYISLADSSDAVRSAYLASLPGDAATQALAKVLLGSNSQGGSGFIDFFLTSAVEPFQEIVQIDRVLADDYVAFLFGQEPPQFQYTGMLLNSMQDDQRSGFARAYQLMLRGTQMARRGALARLRYDSVIVSGVMIAQQQQLNADNELAVPFSFTFLVKEYLVLNNAQFVKTSVADYVKIAADATVAALGPVGTATSVGVRTTTILPQVPSAVSTAGIAENALGQSVASNPMMQLMQQITLSQSGQSVPSNVRGTIDTTAPTPPSPP